MKKGTISGIFKSRYTEWVAVFILISLSISYRVQLKDNKHKAQPQSETPLPYRIANAIDGSNTLFTYELQKN